MMLKPILSVSIILTVNSLRTYESYSVVDVVPYTEQHIQLLINLQTAGFDFWSNDINIESKARILVSHADLETVSQILDDSGMKVVMSITNVQDLINKQFQPAISRMRYTHGSFSWNTYNTLESIYFYLEELSKMYPKFVTLQTIGYSVENRSIYALIVDYKKARVGDPPVAVIEGGAHAREWLSPATVTWILKEILTSTDEEIKRIAENFVWHFIPVLNPDGYKYSFTDDRLWKKNRNTAYYKPCSGDDNTLSNGVDLNRNFHYAWNNTRGLENPCSLNFAGSKPYSEPESRALYNYVKGIKEKILYYFSFHSFGQQIYVPYSNLDSATPQQSADFKNLPPERMHKYIEKPSTITRDNVPERYQAHRNAMKSGLHLLIARSAVRSLRRKFATLYKAGQASAIADPLSGTAFDTFKATLNVSVSLMFMLRDNGQEGFLLTSYEIIPNNFEVMDAIIGIDRQARRLKYYVPIKRSFRVLSSLNVLLVCNVLSLLY